jgi:hypothetical protein
MFNATGGGRAWPQTDPAKKAVGYPEAVLEEVVFEMKGDPCVVTRRTDGV